MAKRGVLSLRQFLFVAMVIVLLAVLPRRFVGPEGLGRVRRLRNEIATLRAAKQRLAEENEQLRLEADALRNDPRAIERVARGELGLVKPEEVVFHVPAGSGPQP